MSLALLRRTRISAGEWVALTEALTPLGEIKRLGPTELVLESGAESISVGTRHEKPDLQDDYSQLGWRPVEEILVDQTRPGTAGHEAIGRTALALMRRQPMLASFDGLIGPEPLVIAADGKELSAHATRVRPFLASLPGCFYEVRCSVNYGEDYRVSHVVDTEFLEAWIAHPAYHLIDEWQS
ncbi:hypothetical protein GCM10027589_09450 [Actinocorallia lasiicapitis]